MHCESRPALCCRPNIGRIAEHFRQRNLADDDLQPVARIHAFDAATPTIEVGNDVAHVLLGSDDFDLHDGLGQHGAGPLHSVLERHAAGDLESNFRRIHIVVGAVVQRRLNTFDLVSGERAALHRLANALLDALDVLARNGAADNLVDEDELDSEINKSALINLIEGALLEAVRKGASDIHFIPCAGKKTEIFMRVDGALLLWHVQENTLPEAVVAVVKDRGKGMDRFEREMGQDGFIQREIDHHIIRFRVSVLPVVGTEIKNKFESVVIRILDDRNVIRDLEKLGLVGYTKDAFVKSINQPQGMVILTGPTGSGKSTTLVAALYQVITPEVNVLTVEDPVEYVIEGARQLKIGIKMNFELAIRSILRHDPDIVLVGEMRDKETAETAIKLANTGHLTFSTLHTNDAPSAVARLYKMGIEPFLIAYAINLIVAQRLIRTLCNKCKKRLSNFDEPLMSAAGLDIAEWRNFTVYKPVGCDECGGSGYKGRMAIHEALYFTKDIRQLIVKSGVEVDEESIRIQAKKDGSYNLRDSGLEKVKLGLTTIEEVLASTSDE